MLLFIPKMDKAGLSHLRSTRHSPAALMTCLQDLQGAHTGPLVAGVQLGQQEGQQAVGE